MLSYGSRTYMQARANPRLVTSDRAIISYVIPLSCASCGHTSTVYHAVHARACQLVSVVCCTGRAPSQLPPDRAPRPSRTDLAACNIY